MITPLFVRWKNQNAIAKTKIKQEGMIRKEKQCTMDITYHCPGSLETSGHHITHNLHTQEYNM